MTKILGITGGSGAGKSTVVEIWRRLGAVILNADTVYHELLQENAGLVTEIASVFPEVVNDGVVDRPSLGHIVFRNAECLALLNDITHKYVIEALKEQIESAKEWNVKVLVVEAVYLIETGLNGMCDITVAVTAPAEKRMSRIMSRDGLSSEEAWLRLKSQQTDEFYLQNCDILIENNHDEAELRERAEEIFLSL